ncbi:ras-GEF domain-containing family member 1B-like isoform X2 [Mya arenaria]|uniref:ras-GEF domain-containing family member 1B-like isoform X2 n=1 Tax=Mya arenaria TaxID=6604 RepID=UPI0022DFF5B2|nr:ras-GEF domain-containing family member 1B-like isoform X2 [Mya arenaria]
MVRLKFWRRRKKYTVQDGDSWRRRRALAQAPRSQPAIGLKQTPKTRPTIFGTITEDTKKEENNRMKNVVPQMQSLSQMFDKAGGGYDCQSTNCNENDALMFKDGNLQAGSVEALIQHLVPTTEYNPDRTYVFTFLLSSRLFIRPHELLAEVCQVCTFQQNLTSDNIQKQKLGKFGQNIIQLLSEWTEMFPYDFRDERMMRQLKEISHRVLNVFPELRHEMGAITHNLLNKLAQLNRYEEVLSKLNAEAIKRSQTQIAPTTDIMEVCPGPLRLAEQLTHIELERLSQIGPEEFVQAFAKEEKKIPVFRDMKKTHNLEAYVQWFNRLSYLVASEICSHLKKKNRVRLVEYFIDVAKECINIGNFNSLMAIIAGMNMNPVARLKKTWAKVNRAKFGILELQMDPSNNFGSYRSCLKAAMWRSHGASDSREKIVIPFFSLFVKDIYFINEGCSNTAENGSINFEKFWQMAKHISDFVTWQQVECPFVKHTDVLHYILTSPVFSETTLSLASYECEPPENSYDKVRHKKLKSEAGL